jgi:hypothetical protein
MASTNILFLYLTPDLPDNKLCTTCTKNILRAYMDFEASVPYAPGLAQSALFPGQTQLYQAITSKCGKDFLGGPAQAAGGIGSNGPLGKKSGGVPRAASTLGFASVGIILAAVGFAIDI